MTRCLGGIYVDPGRTADVTGEELAAARQKRDGYNTLFEWIAMVVLILFGFPLIMMGLSVFSDLPSFRTDNAIGASANATQMTAAGVRLCAGLLAWVLAALIRLRGAIRRP